MFLLQLAAFFISSAVVVVLNFNKVTTNNLNITISLVLVSLIVVINKSASAKANPKLKNLFLFLIILLSSLFVQVFVVSSGGFYSPFLILIHLYTLSISFLLALRSSIIFLFLSFGVLVANVYFTEAIMAKFREDPWTLILYAISFAVIIPLSQTLTKTYHLKSVLSEKLSNLMQIGEGRETSILKSLDELVIVTDKDLKVISANDAFEKFFKLSGSEVYSKHLLDVIKLKINESTNATREDLYIDSVISDRATRFVEGLYLFIPEKPLTLVEIQIRPITDSKGVITQIVFVITDKNIASKSTHSDLAQLKERQNLRFNEIKKQLHGLNNQELKLRVEMFNQGEEDLRVAQELEDHKLTTTLENYDLAYLCKNIVEEEREMANNLGVLLKFSLPEDDVSEKAALSLLESKSELSTNVLSKYSIMIDKKLVSLLIQRLISINLLLAAEMDQKSVDVDISQTETEVNLSLSTHRFLENNSKDLLTEYYGNLINSTYLRYGSGLEGFIAKKIADQLGILLNIINSETPRRCGFVLQFSRNVEGGSKSLA